MSENNPNTNIQISDDTTAQTSEESFKITLQPDNAAFSALGAAAPGLTSLLSTVIETVTPDSFSPELVNQDGSFGAEGDFRYEVDAKKVGEIYMKLQEETGIQLVKLKPVIQKNFQIN